MNQTITHILNGDSLKEQLSQYIEGTRIVVRECLIDGAVDGESFDSLMETRASFIAQYPGCSKQSYFDIAVPEFKKIMSLTAEQEVTCWFEDDLFCQVNFWFVLYLVKNYTQVDSITLVRPNKGNEYSFAHMTNNELNLAFHTRIAINPEQLSLLAKLWPYLQQGNLQKMRELAERLLPVFPFLLPAVDAQIARIPDETGLGYPERVLLEIIMKQESESFNQAYSEFYNRMKLYSFGDLQVRVMYEKLLKLLEKQAVSKNTEV